MCLVFYSRECVATRGLEFSPRVGQDTMGEGVNELILGGIESKEESGLRFITNCISRFLSLVSEREI